MPLSSTGARVIDPILTTVAQGYGSMDYVGLSLFPTVYVNAAGGQIIEFDKASFQLYNSRRAPGAATGEVQFGYLGRPYALINNRLQGVVPRGHLRDAANVAGIDMAQVAINGTMRALAVGLEVEQALLATTLGNYPVGNRVTLAGATKWSASTGTPLTDVDNAREAIRQACGMYPNTMLISAVAFNACKNNPNVVARFQYNGAAGTDASQITPAMLAGLFNLKKVVLGAGIYYNDAGVSVDIWGNNAILAYVPDGAAEIASPANPAYGYTYTMVDHPYAEPAFWDNDKASWKYPVNLERAAVLSGITAGYLIQNPN
jgi:hypothetical protein